MLIRDDVITSGVTLHTAQRVEGWWTVSWLPGRLLDRNQAITGMTIAELVAKTPSGATRSLGARRRALIGALAGELGLSGPDAAARVCSAPASLPGPDATDMVPETTKNPRNPRRAKGLRSESGLET